MKKLLLFSLLSFLSFSQAQSSQAPAVQQEDDGPPPLESVKIEYRVPCRYCYKDFSTKQNAEQHGKRCIHKPRY